MPHAAFSPSASERWIACPASHLRAAALPPAPSSVYAERGTLLHAYAAIGVMESLRAMCARAKADSAMLEADEYAALAIYVKLCKSLRSGADSWQVEQQVGYNDELFGTIDFYAVKDGTLHVVDFKGGRGVLVEADDNPQLLTYALLVNRRVQEHACANGSLRPVTNDVKLHIVQPLFPGVPPMRSVTYPITKLVEWEVTLRTAMKRAKLHRSTPVSIAASARSSRPARR